MITKNYNPSPLEVEFTNILYELKEEMSSRLADSEIVEIKKDVNLDNPDLIFRTKDKDGDIHEFMFRIIQKPDSQVNSH